MSKEGEGWIACNLCDYKCKKDKTMNKHTNSKHEGYKTCEVYERKFTSFESIQAHKESEHIRESEEEFVFSESMLDEFLP